jgi:hypothetical protein
MSTTNYDSRTADKFVVRLPDGLRADIEAAANADDRSMNSVFVKAVRQYLDGQSRQQILLDVLARTVATPFRGIVPGRFNTRVPAAFTDSMHIDDRVKMIGDEPAYLSVVFKLPSLNDAHPLIAQLPYGQKALSTEAVVFGMTTGNLMEGTE